jgi:diaminopimelate epimerase
MIEFFKMHGLGNDFVIIHKSQISHIQDLSHFAKTVSNRLTGVGCDQLIIYTEQGDEYAMSIYNQDGSGAGACGNGTRCLAKLIGTKQIVVNVLGRKLEATLNDDESVTVNMGTASFHESWMPYESALWELASFYKLDPREVVCVSMGNPHLVIFKSDLTDADRALIGKALEYHKLFPNGVNVNFAKVMGDNIILKVWERGDGFTLACGSGACASYAAAKKLGFIDGDGTVEFDLGKLYMSSKSSGIMMRGPAVVVASGALRYE